MQFNRSAVSTLLIVALVALAGIGGVAMSASAATTTLTGSGDQVTGFTANESNDIEYSISSSGTDFSTDGTTTLKMNVTYDGTEYAATSDAVSSGTASSQTLNISNDELADLPGEAGTNTTANVTAWGVDDTGTVTTTATEFTVDITFDNTRSVAEVDDNSATIEDVEEGYLSSFSFGVLGTEDPADLHTYDTTVGIDGSNTTVTIYDETTNGSDAYSEAFREDIESGDVIYGASVGVNDTPIKAFYDSADSDKISDGDTYAVYDSANKVWTVHTGDAQDGATSMDVYISSQDYTSVDSFEQADLNSVFINDLGMNLWSLQSNFGFSAFTSFSLLEAVGIGMIVPTGAGLAVLFVFGRPERSA